VIGGGRSRAWFETSVVPSPADAVGPSAPGVPSPRNRPSMKEGAISATAGSRSSTGGELLLSLSWAGLGLARATWSPR
jgi:hypothetical protein